MFFCKDELYTKLAQVAREREIEFIVDGSTMDDLNDHRPGRRAATQYGVRSPLIEAGALQISFLFIPASISGLRTPYCVAARLPGHDH